MGSEDKKRRVTGSVGAAGKTSKDTVDQNKRRHNRKALEGWLRHYNNRFPSAGREGMINLEALPKPDPGFGPLDRGENMERLSDEDVHRSDLKLHDVIFNRLRRKRWHFYMVLVSAYLDPDASPSIVDKWRAEAADSLPAKLQIGYHNDAIEWILNEVGDYALTVIIPEQGRSDYEASQRKDQTKARQIYFALVDAKVPKPQAAKQTADRTGYSLASIYRIVGVENPRKEKPGRADQGGES